ncbi:hypothetical protein [Kineococcus radiotolerans]|uniref:hypothetical protein n=1 Tax=Kineococcus radiotolerans TaxID=131568 RepID=UPI00003A45DF|nr:hypothetical protein [Kineococcus radiotolerans]
MDERLSGWEDRLRRELDASVRDVRAGDGLLGAAREGGRRRLRRRRALATLPAALVVAGGAVWAGTSRSAPPPALAPAGTPSSTAVTSPVPTAPAPEASRVATEPPVLVMDAEAARDVFFDSGYVYEDAVPLGELWNVDPWEAKALGGQALQNGDELPVPR